MTRWKRSSKHRPGRDRQNATGPGGRGRATGRTKSGATVVVEEYDGLILLRASDSAPPRTDGVAELARFLTADEAARDVFTVVVSADGAGPDLWTRLVTVFDSLCARGVSTVRLALSGAGGDRPGRPAMAQRIADAWRIEVIAPEGGVVIVPGGSLFALGADPPEHGWRSFRPDAEPKPLGPRSPAPFWQSALARLPGHTARDWVVEQVPAGVLLRPPGAPKARSGDLCYAVPVDDDHPTVLVGGTESRGDADIPAEDLAALLAALPGTTRSAVRVAPCGPVDLLPVGQDTAEILGAEVEVLTGLPLVVGTGAEPEVRPVLIGADTEPTWVPFVESVACRPYGPDSVSAPRLVRWRSPVNDADHADSGAVPLSDRWQVSVTRSGLVVGPRGKAPALAGRPVSPEQMAIEVDLRDTPADDELFTELSRVLAELGTGATEFATLHRVLPPNLPADEDFRLLRLAVEHGVSLAEPPPNDPLPEPATPNVRTVATPHAHPTPERPHEPTPYGVVRPATDGRPTPVAQGGPAPVAEGYRVPAVEGNSVPAAGPPGYERAPSPSPMPAQPTPSARPMPSSQPGPMPSSQRSPQPQPSSSLPPKSWPSPRSWPSPSEAPAATHPAPPAPSPETPAHGAVTPPARPPQGGGTNSLPPSLGQIPLTPVTPRDPAAPAPPSPPLPPEPPTPPANRPPSPEPSNPTPPVSPPPAFPSTPPAQNTPSAHPTPPTPSAPPARSGPITSSRSPRSPGVNAPTAPPASPGAGDGRPPAAAAGPSPVGSPGPSPVTPSGPGSSQKPSAAVRPGSGAGRGPGDRAVARPVRRSTEAERVAFRALAQPVWERHSAAVNRAMTRMPALRGVQLDATRTDLVAVHIHLSGGGDELVGRRPDSVGCYTACLGSGLCRLPSYRGVAVRGGLPAGWLERFTPGRSLREPGPVSALPIGAAGDLPARVGGYVIWSSTGRRVRPLVGAASGADEVVFPPGVTFRVLDVRAAGSEPVVLLSEVPGAGTAGDRPGGLDDADRATLERLDEALRRQAASVGAAAPATWPPRCDEPLRGET